MSNENEITILDPSEVSQEVFKRVAENLHSNELTSKTFTRPLPDGGGELAETVIGKLSTGEHPHVLVSTYGLGGTETKGSITVNIEENKQLDLNFHAELFMVANTVTNANKYAEDLAKLAFFVVDTEQPLVPGSIISYGNDEEKATYLFSERSLGTLGDHFVPPVLSTDFAVCFVAVTKLYDTEAEAIKNEELTVDQLNEFLKTLGTDAYTPDRKEYTKE